MHIVLDQIKKLVLLNRGRVSNIGACCEYVLICDVYNSETKPVDEYSSLFI